MTTHLINIVLAAAGFILFAIIQALFINGVKESMGEGMILDGTGKWIKKVLGEKWSKPVVSCVKCMASFWGAFTFWPAAIILFGFHLWEIPVFVLDIVVIVPVNWFVYKKM